jgi:hypothetical protein
MKTRKRGRKPKAKFKKEHGCICSVQEVETFFVKKGKRNIILE